jgi:PTH1 family peptidyl-tRNA hydrolase
VKLIVGLGNPGPRYRGTRHNIGFNVLDALAGRLGAAFSQEKHKSLLAKAQHGAEPLLLQKPMTFMNLSGTAVAAAARNKVHEYESDLLVVVDDVNLPLGRLRFREDGSAGGHNGLKSIIAHLGTQDFARLRIGVGGHGPGGSMTDHVLGSFRPEERAELARTVDDAVEGILLFVDRGIGPAMNEFNRDRRDSGASRAE